MPDRQESGLEAWTARTNHLAGVLTFVSLSQKMRSPSLFSSPPRRRPVGVCRWLGDDAAIKPRILECHRCLQNVVSSSPLACSLLQCQRWLSS